uniref:Uncharacterized protein n=1 Tax=Enterococcus faecium TaxID=1352 RepID=A0A6S6MQE3_ENTFC|nr:hypothetical protein [Enterococcus faecium]
MIREVLELYKTACFSNKVQNENQFITVLELYKTAWF